MYTVMIDLEKCEGCGDCVDSCPVQALELVEEGGKSYAAYIAEPEECIGCFACEEICPEEAITLVEA